jgi:hypothetical protein
MFHWTMPSSVTPIDWDGLTALPLREFEQMQRSISDIDRWIGVAQGFVLDESDGHFANPRYSCTLARLLRLLLSKCDFDANKLFTENEEYKQRLLEQDSDGNAIRDVTTQLAEERRANADSIRLMEESLQATKEEKARAVDQNRLLMVDLKSKDRELEKLRAELEQARKETTRVLREKNDIKRQLDSRDAVLTKGEQEQTKVMREHEHLLVKHKEAMDKIEKMSETLRTVEGTDRQRLELYERDIASLTQQLQVLQQETTEITAQRDKAEDACERREREALSDMQELQQLHKELMEEERQRYQTLREEFVQLRAEFEVRQSDHTVHHELQEKTEEIDRLKKQLQAARSQLQNQGGEPFTPLQNSSSTMISPATSAAETHVVNKLVAEKKRLEAEVESLTTELHELQLKAEFQDTQNLQLSRLLEDYQRGDEGFRKLHREMLEANRTVELLQHETQQLRERLASMEDVVLLCNALKVLCRRVGVTEEELDKIQSSSALKASELETLRQEVLMLKEEADWLEKDRRHWMNKVRLQPLLDTRLRFELGLSAEQLKQLDLIVDQMKSGAVVLEDEAGGSYRDKYLAEAKERQKESQMFNEFIKVRLEEVIATLVAQQPAAVSEGPQLAAALAEMRMHASQAVASASAASAQLTSNEEAERQIRGLASRLDQVELLRKEEAAERERLREDVARLESEKKTICEDRDAYRTFVLDGQQSMTFNTSSIGSPPRQRLMSRAGEDLAPIFKEQLRVKEDRIVQLECAIRNSDAELASFRNQIDALTSERGHQEMRLQMSKEQLSMQSDELRVASEKVQELEKIRSDFEEYMKRSDVAASSRELLQKIVVLRQREAKLLQRLRQATSDQEAAQEAEEKLQRYVNTTLKGIKDAMDPAAASTGFVLPTNASQLNLEGELIHSLRHCIDRISSGALLQEDQRLVVEMKNAYFSATMMQDLQTLRAELMLVKAERDRLDEQCGEQTVEIEHLKLQQAGGANQAAALPAGSTVDLVTWREKCTLLTKRLQGKESEIAMLEKTLDATREELSACKNDSQTLAELQREMGEGGTARLTSGVEAAEQRVKADREIARLKSLNLGLLQSVLDAQCERKKLQIHADSLQRHIQLLTDSGEKKVVTDFVSAALRDNTHLQQQCELAQYQAKKLRLQLLTTEANFRVVANEASAYKLSAYRLYRQYVDQIVKLSDAVRQLQRTSASAVSIRRAELLSKSVLDSLAMLGRMHGANEALARRSTELEASYKLVKDEMALATSRDPQLRQDIERRINTETNMTLRSSLRQITEMKAEIDFHATKLQLKEGYVVQLTSEVARLESGGGLTTCFDDQSIERLIKLRETVFSKSEAPPLAVSASMASVGANAEEDKAIREYKEVLDRQSSLSRQVQQLQEQLQESSKAQAVSEGRARALKEDLQNAEARIAGMLRVQDEDRERTTKRETRLLSSHQSQLDVVQRTADHNTKCLKDILANKDRTIQQLSTQLQTERQKHLEHQLLDTTRMERLHDQLFRENNAMVERFKQTVDDAAGIYQNGGRNPQDSTANLSTSVVADGGLVHQQLHELTTNVIQLRSQVKELKCRNIMLEAQLNEQIAAGQRLAMHAQTQGVQQQPGVAPTSVSATEGALFGVARDQSVALENLRHREMDLLQQVQRQEAENKQLQELLHEARTRQIDAAASLRSPQAFMDAQQQSIAVAELRAQVGFLEQQLAGARDQIAADRAHAEMANAASGEWKQRLDAMAYDLSQQAAQVERAKQATAEKDALKGDLDRLRDQNDKLLSATAMLRQKLLEHAQQSDQRDKAHVQEIAIAQRMGVIQSDATENLRSLQARLESMQAELHQRALREDENLRKSQALMQQAQEQHQLLLVKDRQLLDLKRQLQTARRGTSATASPSGRLRSTLTDAVAQTMQSAEALHPSVATSYTPQPAPPSMAAAAAPTERPQRPTSAPNVSSVPSPPAVDTSLPHVAGAVTRQVMQMQKHAQQELQVLQTAKAKLEAALEDVTRQLEKERAQLTAKNHSLSSELNEVKAAKLKQEEMHRQEILRHLEERRKIVQQQELAAKDSKKKRPLTVAAVAEASAASTAAQTQQQPPPQPEPPAAPAQLPLPPAPPAPPGAIGCPIPSSVAATPVPSAVSIPTLPSQTPPKTKVENGTQTIPADPQPATQAPAPKMDKTNVTKSWVELQSASVDLALHETIRKQKKEIEKSAKRILELEKKTQDTDAAHKEAASRLEEIGLLKAQLAAATHPSATVVASPTDIRLHKRELMKLEEVVDTLRRELNVNKEMELRQHILHADRLSQTNKQLEAEVQSLRAYINGSAPGMPTTVAPATAAAVGEKDDVVHSLENKLLHQEGLLLDLRFERETLAMRVQRLERHVADIMACDQQSAAHQPVGPNKGKTPARDPAALEAVIDNMKAVIERLQHENTQMKSTAVSSTKYLDMVREVKLLRGRERELLERMQELVAKQHELQGIISRSKMSEQHVSLQRKLRQAMSTAEQYQLQLEDLRQGRIIGSPDQGTSPPIHQTPPAVGASPPSPGLLLHRPYAPEDHFLLPHHTHGNRGASPRLAEV